MTGYNIIVQKVVNDEVVHETRSFQESKFPIECTVGYAQKCKKARYIDNKFCCTKTMQCNNENEYYNIEPIDDIRTKWGL